MLCRQFSPLWYELAIPDTHTEASGSKVVPADRISSLKRKILLLLVIVEQVWDVKHNEGMLNASL